MAPQRDMRKARRRLQPTIATRQSLLERLRHWSDGQSWQDFFNRYWRLIEKELRKLERGDFQV